MQERVRISKKQKVIIIVLAALCLLVLVRIVNGPYIKDVPGFILEQNEKAIDVTWKASKKTMTWVMFYDEDFLPEKTRVKGTFKKIPVKKVPKEYKVAVLQMEGFGLPKYSSQTIYMRKIDQVIEVRGWKKARLVGSKFKIDAAAKGKISYKSADPDIAEISEKGEVTCKNDGVVNIILKAKKGEYYNSAKSKLQLRVFPKTLSTPELSAKTIGANVRLSWPKIRYADKYQIYRYDRAKRSYTKDRLLSAQKDKCFVPNESSKYTVRALSRMAGKDIESEMSESVSISSPAESASKYKSIHVLKEIKKRDLREVAYITPQGNAVVPQSFCHTGSRYVVSLVSRKGSDGRLVIYDGKGEKKGSIKADIGYANGSTYNPVTEKVYTVRSHGGAGSALCTSFEVANDYRKDTFDLPAKPSGIAYDSITGKYYMSGAAEVLVTNGDFKKEKKIKKIRHKEPQDIGGHDGVVLVTVWEGSKNSHVDLYRESDSAYIGTYDIPIGEIESVTVVDKHLVVLVHNVEFDGKRGGHILMTKAPLLLP